jgi:LysM repeat protein
MKSSVFIDKLKDIQGHYKTVYMWGAFGAPVSEALITSKSKQYPDWYTAARKTLFRRLINQGYFAFDCVCLIKAILWGWTGDASKSYGGATYESNGVPDTSADGMLTKLIGASADFSNIIPGEAVWMKGHIGVYIGDGKVIECTPVWKNGVQVTTCLNMHAPITGLKGRSWTKHGKLPYVEYETPKPAAPQGRTYTVKAGDSLWVIAATLLGNGNRYEEIKKLNGMSSNDIKPGQILKIPSK